MTNAIGPSAVVLVGGGREAEASGSWSATLEWLVRRVAPALPRVSFVEVRYRVKSWKRLDLCVEDASDAVDAALSGGATRVALVGFSMGGAVALSCAAHPHVETVVGLAPWLPHQLRYDALAGRRFVVIQGSLDRSLPGIPGVTAASSRRGFERAKRYAREAEYMVIRAGLHGAAIRPRGRLVALPRAGRWAALLRRELERFDGAT